MIKSFKCRYTEQIFNRAYTKRFASEVQRPALRKLWMLHAATTLNDLRIPPSNHLEVLRGKRKGQHSIRINDQWRICFKWFEGDAFRVEIVDYY